MHPLAALQYAVITTLIAEQFLALGATLAGTVRDATGNLLEDVRIDLPASY
jgi:hypothetical protein